MSNLEESIVLITSASDKKANVIGTGFAFYQEQNNTYLLTCAHVVEDVGGEENVLVNNIPAKVIAKGDITGFDLAVLRVENLNTPPLQPTYLSLAENRKFRIAGHYLYGEEKKIIIETVDGTLGKKRFLTQSHKKVIAWNLLINQGDRLRKGYSGAPVIDLETGRVLGIATNMEKDGAEGLAISIEALKNIWSDIPLTLITPKFFTEHLDNKGVILEMVYIPGGNFVMGSPENEAHREDNESPQHQVILQPFYMSKYPITQKQYQAIMGENPAHFKGGNRPVENVTWHKAVEYCQKLSQKAGNTYRLPSESQWEYACRAGTTTPFYFGETITTDLVNYDGNYTYGNAPKGKYREETTDVRSFPPNAFGLYDMHGNVWGWCQDVWHDNYNGAPTDGSAWEIGGDSDIRVLRGGGWYNNPWYCRCAFRYRYYADNCNYGRGFRVVWLPGI